MKKIERDIIVNCLSLGVANLSFHIFSRMSESFQHLSEPWLGQDWDKNLVYIPLLLGNKKSFNSSL